MLECPVCKRQVRIVDGRFAYHDKMPPLRGLCPYSKHAVMPKPEAK